MRGLFRGGAAGVNYAIEAERHRPLAAPQPPQPIPATARETRRASMLAGITRGQTAEGRVDEWRRHVDPVV